MINPGKKTYDLAQPYFPGMPHFPNHPPFVRGLTKLHGEVMLPDGGSSTMEVITMSGHTGTHVDALNHFSCNGRFFDGQDVVPVQSYSGGVEHLSVDTIEPMVRRAVVFDIAALMKVDAVEADFVVTPEHLQACKVEIRPGDVVMIRTGWAKHFRNPGKYLSNLKSPGIEIDAARWLSERKPFAIGADTAALERLPSPKFAVHVHLLVETGIHIIENLDLEEVGRDQVREMLFVGAPLKIEAGTGAPIRPLGFVD